jgi:hypothetical protein
VTCARAKENYDYEAPMTSSLSDCTWLEKEWKFHLSTTWHPSLHFYFSFTLSFSYFSCLSYLSCHFSFLFLFFFFHSFILIFFSLFYFSIIFFLSLPYSYFSLYFSLSWHDFKPLNSSLSCMHTIWNFKYTMLETRRNFESRLCSRNAMYKRDV